MKYIKTVLAAVGIFTLALCATAPVTAQENECYALKDFFKATQEKGDPAPVIVEHSMVAVVIKMYNETPPIAKQLPPIDDIYMTNTYYRGKPVVIFMFFKDNCVVDIFYMSQPMYDELVADPTRGGV
jgi:hypothetical protein